MNPTETSLNTVSVCRICMKEKEIYFDVFTGMESINSISQAIMECAPILISPADCFSHLICDNCLENLKIAHNFRTLCIRTDNVLHAQCKTEVISSENEDTQLSRTKDTDNEDDDLVPNLIKTELDIKSENEEILSYFETNIDSAVNSTDNDEKISKNNNKTTADNSKKKYIRKNRKKCGPKKCPILPFPDGLFHCDLCLKKYKYKQDLERHLIMHTSIRYYCDDCGKEFKALAYLKRHQVIHSNERKYNCEYCGAMFHLNSSLLSHRQIHSNVRRHSCTFCEKSFRLKKGLENHMRTHTGERPFVCDVCGKSFNRKHHLSTHWQIHGGKRYKCTVCLQNFITKQNLTNHSMTKHCS